MHILVDAQGTDREPEEGCCKRDGSIAEQPCTLWELIENQFVRGTVA